ncbi:MAG: sulfurtransferase TusA family protein [Candidatus Omnitrophota bacterium]|nr:sulfurtransferase TusA family protein [Candidatus Omnitrophota bacterium]
MFKLPIQIKEQISDYEKSIKEFMDGKMSWARFAGVRVPWGNYSHRGGKIFMARIRIPAGVLTAQQLKGIALCSQNYGNGMLHLTTRQDIQIHEVKLENIIKIHQYLKDYELSSRGGGGNTVRNITSCPLAGICERQVFDVREDAISLSEYLLSRDISYNLPRKFKIAFSGCQEDCAGCLVNDIGLFALKNEGVLGYQVFVGGGMGAKSSLGKQIEDFIKRDDLGNVIVAIQNVFYKYGDRRNKHHNRLRFLIEDIGFELFKEYYNKELKEIKNSEYISLRKEKFSYPEATEEELPEVSDNDYKKFLDYNCQEQKQRGLMLVKLRIPRGDLESEKAASISDLANEFKEIEFRTSQEQNLFVCNLRKKDLYNFYGRIKNILDDFLCPETLLDVVACKGSLTCNLGLCNSPGLAKEIEFLVKRNFIQTNIFGKLKIKINGCPNACGQHPIGNISLHGVARRILGRIAPFYKLLLGGRLGLKNSKLAKDTEILIPARNIPLFLKDFLAKINEDIHEDTDIYRYIEERAEFLAKEIIGKYSYVPTYAQNKDFYIDWGKSEEFSLDGLGPGECGAGVLDMIESDLTEAKIALDQAEKEDYHSQTIKKALFLASRALLVVKGTDPKNEEEAFTEFAKKFIEEKIASDSYSNIGEFFRSIADNLSIEERKERFLYAKAFLEHIKQLYRSMDSTFNFPKQIQQVRIDKPSNVLDLKGTPCPINYVKAKLFLENQEIGDIIEIFLDEGEPINNVPKSLESDGHKILRIEKLNGFYKVVVEKSA